MNNESRFDEAVDWLVLLHAAVKEGRGLPGLLRFLRVICRFLVWFCRSRENRNACKSVLLERDIFKRAISAKHAPATAERTSEPIGSNVVKLRANVNRLPPPPAVPLAEATPNRSGMTRRRFAAACVLATVLASGAAITVVARRREEVFVGEHIREVPLRDGIMHVARNTSYRLHPGTKAHTVHLLNGQAAFHLQSLLGRTRVTTSVADLLASAAEYVVIADEASMILSVIKGSVRVLSSLLNVPELVVRAGEKLILERGAVAGPSSIERVDVQRDISWLKGSFDFDGETVDEAANMFNRFNEEQVIVGSQEVARLTVGQQTSSLADPQHFFERLGQDLGLEIVRDGKLIRVFVRGEVPAGH